MLRRIKGKVNTMIAQTYTMLDNQVIIGNLFKQICDDVAFNGAPVTPMIKDARGCEFLKVKNCNGKVLSFKATNTTKGLLLYGHTFEPLTFEKAYEIIKVRLY